MASGIYGIHNLVNDKWYVGQSQDMSARWNQELKQLRNGHFHSHTRIYHIDRAWQKYGEDSFEWVVLEECPVDQLNDREIYWIAVKDSYMHGYNQTEGGAGARGWKMSDEQRRRLSMSRTGKRLTEETRRKLSIAHKGKSLTPEHVQHMRIATKGIPKPTLRKPVRCVELDVVFPSVSEAAEKMNLHHNSISNCCRGKLKRTGGYHWEFADQI